MVRSTSRGDRLPTASRSRTSRAGHGRSPLSPTLSLRHLRCCSLATKPVHLWRDGFGWHSEQTPPLAFSWPGATARQPLFLFASAGRVTFLERGFLVGLQKFLSIATRSASGWESKGAGEFFSEQQVTDLYRAAISPDGSRIAIGTIDGILYLFDGINLSQLLWQNSSLTPFAVGFAPDGKAWALDYVSDATLDGAIRPPPRNAVLYGEF